MELLVGLFACIGIFFLLVWGGNAALNVLDKLSEAVEEEENK
jgi:hypothetical protein